MKELSIEEKAKAYDEAKARMSKAYNSNRCTIGFMNEIFPELKGSEDERIKQELIEYFQWAPMQYLNDFNNKRVVAWLEKQGEQKPADKAEPKFKVGDWVVSPNGVYWHIDKISNNRYEVTADTGECADWPLDTNIYHRFTIQDAKDGDVLCTYECDEPKIVFILKGTPKKHYALSYHCYYNIMYPHFESDSEKGCLAPNDENVKPATKEQRDILEKAMADAGYEWDAERKELKKIEKKPAAWSEEDEHRINDTIYFLETAKKHYASTVELDACIDWVKSIRHQNKWKPSERQKEALLWCVVHLGGADKQTLGELLEELNKL